MVINGNVPNLNPHDEDPALPGYTVAGDDCAISGNVMRDSLLTTLDKRAIDGWLTAPFHALGVLDPKLQTTGFGSFRGEGTSTKMSAALDVIRGRTGSGTYPVFFPGNGSTVPLRAYGGGESPDPLTSCPGYLAPTGLPLILQLGPGNVTPSVTAYSLTGSGGMVDVCLFDETSYTNPAPSVQASVRTALGSRDAVVLIPKQPLSPGATYTASVTSGGQVYSWTFSIAPAVPLTVSLDADPAVPGIQASRSVYLNDTFAIELRVSPGGIVRGFDQTSKLWSYASLSYLGGFSAPISQSETSTTFLLEFKVVGLQPAASSVWLTDLLLKDYTSVEAGSCLPVILIAATCNVSVSIVIDPDRDDDGDLDDVDNCPAWPNPSQALPNWPIPPGDADCDGYPDTVPSGAPTLRNSESSIGTTVEHCAATPALHDEPLPDAWPPDFNDNQLVNIGDIVMFNQFFGMHTTDPDVNLGGTLIPVARLDLNGNGIVNVGDVLQLNFFMFKRCDGT